MFNHNDPVRVISKIKNNRLLNVLEESGLRVPDFVNKLGICLNTWYQLTSLKRYPSMAIANKLSQETGLSVEELFPGYLKKIAKTVAVNTIPDHTLVQLSEAKASDLLTEGTQESYVIENEKKERISEILKTLPPREEQIIKMRFGLDNHTEWSLGDLAYHFGVTKERIRQIEEKALMKLRSPERSHCVKDFA